MTRVVLHFLRVQQGLLNPKKDLRSTINFCMLARVVSVPTQGQAPLPVVNFSSSTVTLYKGVNVAQFYPLAISDGTDAETAEYYEVPLSAQGQARRVHQVGPSQSAVPLLGIVTSNMDKAHKQALEELVLEFAEIFSTGKQDLGCTVLMLW